MTNIFARSTVLRLAALILGSLVSTGAIAVDYNLPSGFGSGAFSGCTGSAGSYTCTGNRSLGNNDTVTLTANVTLTITGNLNLANGVRLGNAGFVFDINVNGDVDIGNNAVILANITAGGDFDMGNNAQVTGDISAGGDIDMGNNGQITGDITAVGDVDVGNNNTIAGNVTGDTLDFGNNTTVSGVCTPPHPICMGTGSTLAGFVISPATTAASTCLANAITLTAVDGAGSPISSYAGSVTLSTSSGNGNWSIFSALGALAPNPDTDDDGSASYAFVAADNGDAILNFTNTHAETLTITVTDAAAGISSTSAAISFARNVFLISEDPVQVAGRPQAMSVAMWTDDAPLGSAGCNIDPNYNYAGLVIDAGLVRSGLDPAGASPTIGGISIPDAPASSGVTLNFSAGVASFELASTDVGQYRLRMTDNTNTHGNTPITGDSALLTVRPFGLALTNVNVGGTPVGANPTLPSGDRFASAGDNFSATVSAVLWIAADDTNNDGVLDTGVYTDNPATPGYAWDTDLVVFTDPASYWPTQAQGGVAGNLFNGNLAAAGFTLGAQTPANLQYTEVGAFTLQVSADNYLGEASADITGNDAVVGRFSPAQLLLAKTTDGTLNNANSLSAPTFTYIGQDFDYQVADRPAFTITAQFLRQGLGTTGTTENYFGAWAHIANAGIILTAPATDDLTVDTNGVTLMDLDFTPDAFGFTIDDNLDGSFNVTFGDDKFNYPKNPDSRVAPFDSAITLTIPSVIEVAGDGITSVPVAGLDFNPAAVQMLFGRLRLGNTFGSELSPLNMEAFIEHFDLLGVATPYWVLHDDGDTNVTAAQILAQPPGSTTPGNPVATLPPGRYLIPLAAPGTDTLATISVELDQPGFDKPWLQYDWDEGGVFDDNPSALATFGVYEGNPVQIYLQQTYQ